MITLNNNNLEITEGTFQSDSRTMLSSPSVTPEMDDNMDKTTIKITKGGFENLIRKHMTDDVLGVAKWDKTTLYYDGDKHFASWENGSGWYYAKTKEDKCYDCLDEYETELLNHNNKTFCKDCLEWRALAKNIKGGK